MKSFRLNVIFRVLIIAVICLFLVFISTNTKWYFTIGVTSIILVFLIWGLIYYVESVSREISKFVMSIKYNDFTKTYSNLQKSTPFYELKKAFNEIYNEFQNIRVEKEIHYQYLQMIVEHVKIGLICYDDEGNVHLYNMAAKQLLKRHNIKKINDIEKINHELMQAIYNHNLSERVLLNLSIEREEMRLALLATEFKLRDNAYVLISLQDIRSELEAQELESWQKLIRVLRHEIMNSVTPIASLAEAINEILWDDEQRIPLIEIDEDDADDIYSSLKTIENRSKGLIRFVNSYRIYTQIPTPKRNYEDLLQLITDVTKLLNPDFEHYNITLKSEIPKGVKIYADRELIEQVFINVLINAKEAVKNTKTPTIKIRAIEQNENIIISFEDNGTGIPKEDIDKIFIPFYTTRKKGSGIGLSLTRQIMNLHNGTITVDSDTEKGTCFKLKF